jgi:hypothetical protein
MSPAAFSANLVKCMQNDWQLGGGRLLALVPMNLKLKVKWARLLSFGFGLDGTFELDLLRAELQKDPQTALQTIMDAYLKLVKDAKKTRKAGDPWPVIIIDEANALMKWKDKDSLDSLLAFFVYLTKQEQLAHVILATSDTFLTQWLDLGARIILGVCLCASARRLIRLRAQAPSKAHSAPRVCWATCHARRRARISSSTSCPFLRPRLAPTRRGGACTTCAAATRACCSCALARLQHSEAGSSVRACAAHRSFAVALRCAVRATTGCNAIVQTAMTDISHGLFPEVSWKDAAWSAEDFRTVMRSIVSSPHAAVPVLQMYAELGDDGAAKLESMNAKNLLLRRAYNPLARDIDEAAFREDREDVYTLPTAAHVLAARRKLKL